MEMSKCSERKILCDPQSVTGPCSWARVGSANSGPLASPSFILRDEITFPATEGSRGGSWALSSPTKHGTEPDLGTGTPGGTVRGGN